MYKKAKILSISNGAGMSVKNLQVVSFDSDWKEIYLGTIRRNHFSAFCPHNVPNAVSIDFKWLHEDEGPDAENSSIVTLTVSKWCPLENCTVLALGSQFGIKLFDWDGSTLIYYYDFIENGIGIDEREVTGGQARGISALGSNYIAVGIHTGTIILFKVISNEKCFTCTVIDSQRCHVNPISDLASSSLNLEDGEEPSKEFLASGDEAGRINLWELKEETLRLLKVIDTFGEFPITTLAIWNRIAQGVVVAGYGSGHIRIFSVTSGAIVAEATAHAGWITGMDSANSSGLLVTCSEDGFVRVS